MRRVFIKKFFLNAAGIIFLSIGIIGIFIPLLPTTPFLLLAAACFMKSSKSLYHWLISHRLFGSYIKNYLKFRAVSVKSKIISITLLWLVIFSSIIFFTSILWIRILLSLIAIGITIHLIKMRTLTQEMTGQMKTID